VPELSKCFTGFWKIIPCWYVILHRTDVIVFAWSSRVNKCRNSSSDDSNSSRVAFWFPGLGLVKVYEDLFDNETSHFFNKLEFVHKHRRSFLDPLGFLTGRLVSRFWLKKCTNKIRYTKERESHELTLPPSAICFWIRNCSKSSRCRWADNLENECGTAMLSSRSSPSSKSFLSAWQPVVYLRSFIQYARDLQQASKLYDLKRVVEQFLSISPASQSVYPRNRAISVAEQAGKEEKGLKSVPVDRAIGS